MSEIAEHLGAVRARIVAACRRAGRDPGEVTLVAVSKLQPLAAIREAYVAGQRDFGENYAQELRDKAKALADLTEIRWHAIGPLQANKAKYVAPVAALFHALDSLEIAAALASKAQGRKLPCLVEVNLGEASKAGVPPERLEPLARQLESLPGVKLVGLTALPPPAADPEASRPHFRRLRELARGLPWARQLSMGTTQDFEVAVEEGATLVRVGTALFGERPPRPPRGE